MNETQNAGRLSDLLMQSGAKMSVGEMSSVIDGVAAAPLSAQPDEWMVLVTENPPDELVLELRRQLDLARQSDGGLDGEQTHPERIKALRSELAKIGVDGFIVPRTDAHQGEYVSLNCERLAWITGFTGSAGSAVVLTDKAALFVDGRYTLQAKDQVDDQIFEICHMIDMSATEWVAASMAVGAKLAYDPWLLTPNQVKGFQTACKKAGAELVAIDTNLIDVAWTNRPQDPISPIIPHTDIYTGNPSAEKRLAIGKQVSEQGIDTVFLSAPDSIAWLFNIRGADVPYTPFALSFALLNADGTADWFVDPRKLTKAVKKHLGNGVVIRAPHELGDALQALGAQKATVRLSPGEHPAWVFQQLESAGGKVNHGTDPCQLIKAVKNQTETTGMRNAHTRDGAAVCRFLAWIDGNASGGQISELSASDQLELFRRENDLFRGLSFPTIAGSGPNGAIVHYRVTERSSRTLDHNSLFLVDSGAQYLDGTTDITRTIAIGTPTGEMRRNFTLVLKGHIALAQACFPVGTTGSQLDVLARSHLWSAGLDYDHGTGHGVGAHLSVHEGPQRISKMPSTVALQPGMVISNEPGYYKEAAFGIRIENLVCVCTRNDIDGAERPMLGFETLTFAPIDRRVIETEILTDAEIAWLDAYHSEVLAKIGPQLADKDLDWLKAAAAPLTV